MTRQSRAPTILLTRPLAQSQRFAAALADVISVPVVISPLMATEFLSPALPHHAYSAVLLTSETGAIAAGRLRDHLPKRAWCVGDRTAQVATEAGFDALSAKGDAGALAQMVWQSNETGRLLHLRGENVTGDLAGTVTKGGIVTDHMIVYRQVAQPLTAQAIGLLMGAGPVVVPLFSVRSAQIFAQAAQSFGPVWVAAMAPIVAAVMTRPLPLGLEIAETPDAAGMLLAVQRLVATACSS